MAEVVGLDGKQVEESGDVNYGVVSLLERLLGEARAGRVSGIAVCYTTSDGDDILYQSDWAGPKVTLLGSLVRATYALNRTLDEADIGRIGETPS